MQTHPDKAKAQPQKDFFINMLTKDISLADCILDLLDNSVDGANNHSRQKSTEPTVSFAGYKAEIILTEKKFTIIDNCGGIPLDIAKNVAFNFGRPPGKAIEAKHSIGFYGIGMKRALFKIGDSILIQSSTGQEAFLAQISVDAWSKKEDWDFELDIYDEQFPPSGTTIEIEAIDSAVSTDFGNPSFLAELLETIARDYMFILSKGFEIKINGISVKPATLALVTGDKFKPLRLTKSLSAKGTTVDVELIVGLWNFSSQEEDEQTRSEFDSGWYIICNDRVVLAADKTEKSGWGKTKPIGRKWHSQYKPFIGFALFSSDDPKSLPWNTTKRGVDLTSEIYRQALVLMADATKSAIQYTNQRKKNINEAEKLETQTTRATLLEISPSETLVFPPIEQATETSTTNTTSATYIVPEIVVSYPMDKRRIQNAKEALGNSLMSDSEVGKSTFEYFYSIEVGK